MPTRDYVAFDFGASNGRGILGRFDGARLSIHELNRFPNEYVRVGDEYYWDILHLYTGMKKGLAAYAKEYGGTLSGIGIDTWGVDFGLIDAQGRLLGNPRSYRDPRGARGQRAFYEKYGERTAFDITGIANLEFNTVYQLYDMVLQHDPQLAAAEKMLLMPDLLGYLLCGEASAEYTFATTTQMLDSKSGRWSEEIVGMLGVDAGLLPAIRMSGERKADLLSSIREETGLVNTPPVYCVGAHDTASAVASVPAENESYAYLSSGTWSLIGMIRDKALVNDTVYGNQFSNEGAIDGRARLLRNIMGLWIIQNCKQEWDRQGRIDWDHIVKMAQDAPGFQSFIDVNAHGFFCPGDMPEKIRRFCRETGQHVPETKGEIARTVYESLAMSYRDAFAGLEDLKGCRIGTLHIVGGGSKNALLNQYTANALNRRVVAGPAEATAIGNIMVQLEASGEVGGQEEARQVVRDSFDVARYEPMDTALWEDRYRRYREIIGK